MTHTVHQVRLSLISICESLACVPMMTEVAEKYLTSAKPELKKIGAEITDEHDALIEELDSLGIVEPIKAYRVGRRWIAVDGRHRLAWAADRAKAEQGKSTFSSRIDPKIPLIEISKADAVKIIEASVIGRRHWTKGQRAWLGVMQHPEVADATLGRPNKSADSITISGEAGLAARLGVSTDVVNQAVQLYRLFFAPGSKVGSPEAIEAAACKAKYEHLIWGGAGLGGVLAGIAGGDATKDKPKAPTGFHHLDAPLASLSRLGKVWMTWTPEERAKGQALIVARIRGSEESAGWPDEFRQAIAEAIVAAD